MDAFLQQTFERLIDNTNLEFKRYLYHQFKISRLTGIVGARGVGKTTLMLQYIKEHLNESNTFYFSADSVYFKQNTLLEFVSDYYNHEGTRLFFIDEVHKYENWNQELKNLYDSFPDIRIVYSGSSMAELVKGSHDLSRRTKLYYLTGMSFREYLNFYQKNEEVTISLPDLLSHPNKFNKLGLVSGLMGKFKKYLATGYYPFFSEDPHTYYERVIRIIQKIVFEDIPNLFDLKTQNLHLFQKILTYLSTIPPGEVNTNNIAKNMNIAHQTMNHYLTILESVGLIQMIYAFEGVNQQLRKPQKIFLQNTNLLYALQECVGEPLDKGILRELFFIQSIRDSGEQIYYSKQGDFRTKTQIFEIGGKNKTNKQIANLTLPAFLVKDDILAANQNIIPLVFFGFLS